MAKEREPRNHVYYPTLKEVAKDLLRDCETAVEAQAFGKELAEAFSVALADVALEKWYGDN